MSLSSVQTELFLHTSLGDCITKNYTNLDKSTEECPVHIAFPVLLNSYCIIDVLQKQGDWTPRGVPIIDGVSNLFPTLNPLLNYLKAVRSCTIGHLKYKCSGDVNEKAINASLQSKDYEQQFIWGFNTNTNTIYQPKITYKFISDLVDVISCLTKLVEIQYYLDVYKKDIQQFISNARVLLDVELSEIRDSLSELKSKWLDGNEVVKHVFEFKTYNIQKIDFQKHIATQIFNDLKNLKEEHQKISSDETTSCLIESCFINHFFNFEQLPNFKKVTDEKYFSEDVRQLTFLQANDQTEMITSVQSHHKLFTGEMNDRTLRNFNAHFSSAYLKLFFKIEDQKLQCTMNAEQELMLRLTGEHMNKILGDVEKLL